MITDEMIAEAAAKYNDALVQYWQNVEMEEHEFSSKFERKMCRLIWKVKYPYMHKALKSAACILIAFLISFASVMTFNVEARAAFIEWLKSKIDGAIVFQYIGMPVEIERYEYILRYLPEDYIEKTCIKEENYTTVIYVNDEGKQLTFNYTYATDATKIYLCAAEHETLCVTVGNYNATIYIPIKETSRNDIVWIDGNNVYFRVSAYADASELVKLAESVSKKF